MSLSHDDVLRILALLDASDFDELRLETSDYKLHVRRGGPAASPAAAGSAVEPATEAVAARTKPLHATPASNTPIDITPTPGDSPLPSVAALAPVSPTNASLSDVKTPLLGTFYRSPQPGAAPFVEVGSQVDDDTVIGIVEVMKLMSSISAGATGLVAEILATDGALVEYNEVLMRIATPGA